MQHDDRWDDHLLAAIHAPSALLAEALVASALVEDLTGRRAPTADSPDAADDEPVTAPLRPVRAGATSA